MAVNWNVSNLSNDIGVAVTRVNMQTDYYLAAALLIMFFIISLILTRNMRTSSSMLTSSFIVFVLSLPMTAMGMIPGAWAVAPAVLLGVSIFLAWRDGSTDL